MLIIRQFAAFLAVIAYMAVSACSPHQNQQQEYQYSIFTFGTLLDITLYGSSANQAEQAFQQLQQDFDRYHDQWSPWTRGELAQLNQAIESTNTEVTVSENLLPLIEESIRLSKNTDNLFNPAIGKLINLWQFHRYQEDDIAPPPAGAIAELVQQNPTMSDLEFTASNRMLNHNAAVLLNFGAYAKGYGIELALSTLKRFGIENAVINAGGDLAVIGQHGDRKWNIGIKHPRSDSILASIEVNPDESVFTSGDYERVYYYQGKRYHHILDPRTGYPTQDSQSVTVLHERPAVADAMATALFVAGRDQWFEIARKNRLKYVMLIDGDGNIHLTPDMQQRIKFINKSPSSHIIVSKQL
jgi:thiamine biosynthesis lipoprotein